MMDRRVSAKATHAGPTRHLGSHGRPYRRRNPATYSRSAPSRCRCPARDGKGVKGVGPPPTYSPERHPGGKRHHRNLHSDLAASHHSPLPQDEERDGPPSRLFVDLRRQQHLPPNLFLPGPPPRAHPGHPRSRCSDRTFASPTLSIFCRTRKRPAACDKDKIPTVDGTGFPVKGRIGRVSGPEGPRHLINIKAP